MAARALDQLARVHEDFYVPTFTILVGERDELARESEKANAPDKPKPKRLPYPGAGEPLTEG